eukprot:m.356971 g.356971  ORF g.356971 m.356971 type:complete len:59 (+) comp17675_c0_seq1:217-393(+)
MSSLLVACNCNMRVLDFAHIKRIGNAGEKHNAYSFEAAFVSSKLANSSSVIPEGSSKP